MRKMPVRELEPGMVLAQDVFASSMSDTAVLRRDVALDERSINHLKKWKVGTVFIVDGNEERPLGELVAEARHQVEPAKPVVSEELRGEALHTLEDFFEGAEKNGNVATVQMVERLDRVVDDLVAAMSSDKKALVNLSGLKSYDDYTFHHSLSVAVMSVGLAMQMGLSNRDIRQLALASIMHDIGKTAVPVELIRKPGRLTDDEFRLIKTHSAEGERYLATTGIGDEGIWQSVAHHHEKLDGTGYPSGLKGNEIPMFSRIISVADVYDALTSNRPYRTPMQPAEASEYIMGGVGYSFDFDVVWALMRKTDMYPVGSVIELSNGYHGLVINNENKQRPIIELLGSGEVLDLYADRMALSLVIKRVVPAEALGTLPGKKPA